MFVSDGARKALMKDERQRFLEDGVAEGLRHHPAPRPVSAGAAAHAARLLRHTAVRHKAVPRLAPTQGNDNDDDN